VRRFTRGGGRIVLPAVPSLVDDHVDYLSGQFLLARK
jgi:hypothetical protein